MWSPRAFAQQSILPWFVGETNVNLNISTK
jgi:hypothetical protein